MFYVRFWECLSFGICWSGSYKYTKCKGMIEGNGFLQYVLFNIVWYIQKQYLLGIVFSDFDYF